MGNICAVYLNFICAAGRKIEQPFNLPEKSEILKTVAYHHKIFLMTIYEKLYFQFLNGGSTIIPSCQAEERTCGGDGGIDTIDRKPD